MAAIVNARLIFVTFSRFFQFYSRGKWRPLLFLKYRAFAFPCMEIHASATAYLKWPLRLKESLKLQARFFVKR